VPAAFLESLHHVVLLPGEHSFPAGLGWDRQCLLEDPIGDFVQRFFELHCREAQAMCGSGVLEERR